MCLQISFSRHVSPISVRPPFPLIAVADMKKPRVLVAGIVWMAEVQSTFDKIYNIPVNHGGFPPDDDQSPQTPVF